MNKHKQPRAAWVVEWKQVYHSDRDERLQRAFALILPQAEAKVRHQTGEKHHAPRRRPLR
jgi:hypothetical protein